MSEPTALAAIVISASSIALSAWSAWAARRNTQRLRRMLNG